jgi:hypothetical protein
MGKLNKTNEFDKENTIAVIKRKQDSQLTGGAVNFLEDEDFDKLPETKDECEIRLSNDFYFTPVPRDAMNRQFAVYCAGKKGAGKTTIMSRWMLNYKTLTKNPVYLISSKTYDDTIDSIIGEKNINRIPTTAFEDKEEMPQLEAFENCLVCFDDFMNDHNSKNMLHLMNQIAERGRAPKVSLFTIFHNITNSHKTKLILTEADYFIIFPSSLSTRNFYYFMNSYGSISDSKLLKKIRNEVGKSVVISVEPNFVICTQCVFLPKGYSQFK